MALSNARLAKHPDRADVTLYNKDEAELLIQDFRGGTLANVTLYDVSTTKWWFISPEDFDTIGGLIAHEMGHVPRRNEQYVLAGLKFVVMHTKGGAVKWFKVSPVPDVST